MRGERTDDFLRVGDYAAGASEVAYFAAMGPGASLMSSTICPAFRAPATSMPFCVGQSGYGLSGPEGDGTQHAYSDAFCSRAFSMALRQMRDVHPKATFYEVFGVVRHGEFFIADLVGGYGGVGVLETFVVSLHFGRLQLERCGHVAVVAAAFASGFRPMGTGR